MVVVVVVVVGVGLVVVVVDIVVVFAVVIVVDVVSAAVADSGSPRRVYEPYRTPLDRQVRMRPKHEASSVATQEHVAVFKNPLHVVGKWTVHLSSPRVWAPAGCFLRVFISISHLVASGAKRPTQRGAIFL
jgi:hypothetical protein